MYTPTVREPIGFYMDMNTALYRWILAFDIFCHNSDRNWATPCSLLTYIRLSYQGFSVYSQRFLCTCFFFSASQENSRHHYQLRIDPSVYKPPHHRSEHV